MNKTQLIQFADDRSVLDKTTSLKDVKILRDKADVWTRLAKERGLGLTQQNEGAKFKLLAERKMGELLRGMDRDKRGGDRKSKIKVPRRTLISQLKELGIKRNNHIYGNVLPIMLPILRLLGPS